jgi:ABC-type nitrate/sulfonate/bicarbonate transport system substrate-binding protein
MIRSLFAYPGKQRFAVPRWLESNFFCFSRSAETARVGTRSSEELDLRLHGNDGGRARAHSARFCCRVQVLGVISFLFFFTAPGSAQQALRVGTIFSATQAPLWAAREGRFFDKYGIKNIEVIQFSGGQPVTRALVGGDIQISTTGGAAVVNARLKGADSMIIARTVGVFPYTLYVGKEIRDPADLKGKRLAVSTIGGSGYVAMQYTLRKLGVSEKEVTMLQIGDFGTRLASLVAGAVQGTLLLPPFTIRAKELGLKPLYELVGSGIEYPINQITTRQSLIKSERETVKNFLKGLTAGLAKFRTDREFGTKVLSKNLRENDPKILQETYDFWLKVFPKFPRPGPEDATVFLEMMQVKEQRNWREFVDPSLMEELEREGFLDFVYK